MKTVKIILLITCFFVNSLAAVEITVVGNTWSPYVDENLPKKGMAAEIVTTALDKAGYQTTFRIDSWPRALEGAGVGVYDVIGTIWRTDKRANDLTFSKPYLVNEIRFIKRKEDKISFNRLEDLEGSIIGIVKDYAYDNKFLASKKFVKVANNHVIQNLLSLKNREIDLTLGDHRTLVFDLRKYLGQHEKEFELLPKSLSKRGLRIAVSKNHANHQVIVTAFDKAVIDMKKDGSLDAILKKYDN